MLGFFSVFRASSGRLAAVTSHGRILAVSADATQRSDGGIRSFSGKNADNGEFRPKRRPGKNYRPFTSKQKYRRDWAPDNDHKTVNLGEVADADDDLERKFGKLGAETFRAAQTDRDRKLGKHRIDLVDHDVDEDLRGMDYFLSEPESTEDQVGERRALGIDLSNEDERAKLKKDLNDMVRDQAHKNMGIDRESLQKQSYDEKTDEADELNNPEDEYDVDTYLDPMQLAHGNWYEYLITVDRTTKLWRGGRLESYRALVIGGNFNGCGGFGVGKSHDPNDAVNVASRLCKRNIFFVNRYQGNGITRDLVGKQNSVKVVLRATDNGLRGNYLVREILKRFGITNAQAKAYGKRSVTNVVRATFKALMTHESLEEIAMKRGKRLLSLDKAMRLKI